MNKIRIGLLTVIVLVSFSMAQLPNSTKTLLHTQTGNGLEQGHFLISTNVNFYTKKGEYTGAVEPADFKAKNYWLIAGNLVMSYGLLNHFDASLGVRLYQKTNRDNGQNLPDDLFLTLRAGSFAFAQNHFKNALLASFRFPTGQEHNYPFAEYASGSFEYSLMYALSYVHDAYLPNRAFSIHFNIGWWNHNESGKTFKFDDGTELKAAQSSKDIRLALASVFPSDRFDFRLELSGIIYETKPSSFIYSAEEWAFLSPSIRYKPWKGMDFDLGLDIRLSAGDRQWTTANIPDLSTNLDLPKNYPAWKIHFGTNFSFDLLRKSSAIRNEKDYYREEKRQKIELYEKILEERKSAQRTQEELESLRKLRKKTDQAVEELKKAID